MADVEFSDASNAFALEVLIVRRQDSKYCIFGVLKSFGARIELPVVTDLGF